MLNDILVGVSAFVIGYVGWPSVFLLTGPWARRLTSGSRPGAPAQIAVTHAIAAIALILLNFLLLIAITSSLSNQDGRHIRAVAYLSSFAGLFFFLALGKFRSTKLGR